MAKKIDGFVDGTWEGEKFIPYKEGNRYLPFWEEQGISTGLGLWRPATIVLHKGKKAERVFTESEVRAILRDLLAASEDGPFMPNYDRMDEMVKFHGLSFDPA